MAPDARRPRQSPGTGDNEGGGLVNSQRNSRHHGSRVSYRFAGSCYRAALDLIIKGGYVLTPTESQVMEGLARFLLSYSKVDDTLYLAQFARSVPGLAKCRPDGTIRTDHIGRALRQFRDMGILDVEMARGRHVSNRIGWSDRVRQAALDYDRSPVEKAALARPFPAGPSSGKGRDPEPKSEPKRPRSGAKKAAPARPLLEDRSEELLPSLDSVAQREGPESDEGRKEVASRRSKDGDCSTTNDASAVTAVMDKICARVSVPSLYGKPLNRMTAALNEAPGASPAVCKALDDAPLNPGDFMGAVEVVERTCRALKGRSGDAAPGTVRNDHNVRVRQLETREKALRISGESEDADSVAAELKQLLQQPGVLESDAGPVPALQHLDRDDGQPASQTPADGPGVPQGRRKCPEQPPPNASGPAAAVSGYYGAPSALGTLRANLAQSAPANRAAP